jgi:signal transduction histidine kinase
VPGETASLLTTVSSLLDSKDDIESRFYQLSVVPMLENARTLGQTAGAAYEGAVASADRARNVLSIYAVVLLLIIGIIAVRLRNSYRELNLANEELGELNESLEQRVEERTEKLSNALTDLKESQVQLVQAEKMSSLGQLVAGISHEINTPLLYLANNAELTQERVGVLTEFVSECTSALCVSRSKFKGSTEYQAHLIKSLRKIQKLLREQELEATVEELGDLNRDSIEGLEDLSNMAQSLKDFSRLDRAPVDSFDVNAGIEKTLTIARNIIKHKAEVVRNFGELPPIECSPSKINQVFLNLITNAAQAIEDQGEIKITTETKSDEVMISISDNGCGIPVENLSKIRDPFFTTKEVGSGTGLGLSIVEDIVRSHGGRLLIESEVGVGSTFCVVLPIRQAAVSSEPEVDAMLAEAV